jgi:hypothetical protein
MRCCPPGAQLPWQPSRDAKMAASLFSRSLLRLSRTSGVHLRSSACILRSANMRFSQRLSSSRLFIWLIINESIPHSPIISGHRTHDTAQQPAHHPLPEAGSQRSRGSLNIVISITIILDLRRITVALLPERKFPSRSQSVFSLDRKQITVPQFWPSDPRFGIILKPRCITNFANPETHV